MKTWYHFLPISLALHAGFFALAWFCIPDTPAFQIFALETEHEERIVVFEEIEAFDDSDSEIIHEEAVQADEDPFEEPEIVIAQPEMHFESPSVPKDLPEDTKESESEMAQTPTPGPEITADFIKTTAEPQTDIDSAQNQPGNGEFLNPQIGTENGDAVPPSHSIKHEAPKAANAAAKIQEDETDLWKAYTLTLSNHFKQHKHYPDMAKRLRLTGTVWLLVEVSRTGEILSAEIAQSSGVDILDEAALDSAKKAGPVPVFPDGTSAERKKLKIPYSYRLK